MSGSTSLAEQLKMAGFRMTRQRAAVLRAMADSPTPLSALQLWNQAKRNCPCLGLATVYRTLDVLNMVGGVERCHAASGRSFVSCPPGDHHHVVCVVCGRVAEFSRCNVASLIPEVSRETGFHVESHLLELAGICPTCLAEEKAE
ncbi:MAG: transcriptional repressor [Gaiellales bacterium]|nr:transcriptional repressor [Gaiellales bacterium]